MITVLDEGSAVAFEYGNEKWKHEPYMSYTVLRAKFDAWFADQVAAKGAFIIPRKKVDDLLVGRMDVWRASGRGTRRSGPTWL